MPQSRASLYIRRSVSVVLAVTCSDEILRECPSDTRRAHGNACSVCDEEENQECPARWAPCLSLIAHEANRQPTHLLERGRTLA